MKYELDHIYNEDCYKAIKDIPDKSIDLVYIDIPYDISYQGGGCLQNNIAHNVGVMKANKRNLTSGIDYSLLSELTRVLKYIYIYIWCSKSQINDLMNYFVQKGCNFNILCWCKDNPVPFGASNFLSDIEYCLCFYEKGAKFNDGAEHKSKWYISHLNTKDGNYFGHPTIKPLELVKRHLINSTNENDVVLDCFMGSGTTAVACKELNRHFIGFEIDKDFYRIACDRLNGITKEDREKINNGQMTLF